MTAVRHVLVTVSPRLSGSLSNSSFMPLSARRAELRVATKSLMVSPASSFQSSFGTVGAERSRAWCASSTQGRRLAMCLKQARRSCPAMRSSTKASAVGVKARSFTTVGLALGLSLVDPERPSGSYSGMAESRRKPDVWYRNTASVNPAGQAAPRIEADGRVGAIPGFFAVAEAPNSRLVARIWLTPHWETPHRVLAPRHWSTRVPITAFGHREPRWWSDGGERIWPGQVNRWLIALTESDRIWQQFGIFWQIICVTLKLTLDAVGDFVLCRAATGMPMKPMDSTKATAVSYHGCKNLRSVPVCWN